MSTILFNQELAKKKNNFIFNVFSHKYFLNKKILDAGCGNGEIALSFFRLGSDVTIADARQEHLSAISKKYPSIKTLKLDFENPFSFGSKFDVTLSIGTLCHVKNYEKHLKDLCLRTKDLILETSVCDSDDPNVSFEINEDKSIHGLSFSGKGSRPSAAKIEKILIENGMSFIRLDVPDLNFDKYIYDWQVSNSNNKALFLRRFWICSKSTNVVKEIGKKFKKQIVEPGIRDNLIEEAPQIVEKSSIIENNYLSKNNYNENINNFFNLKFIKKDDVEIASKQYSIFFPEKFSPKKYWNLKFTVAPMTFSSKQWVSKIHPFFPNLNINKKILDYKCSSISNDLDLSICSIDNIFPSKNIFIEEWSGEVSQDSINNLNSCEHIITPSFENYIFLKSKLPNKKISRSSKFWLNPGVTINDGSDYAIYFEKNKELTSSVVNNFFKLNLNKLIVVGSRLKLPKEIVRVSEYEDYKKIINLIINAKVVIDVSNNQSYDSSIINFAKLNNIPVITNNYHYITDSDNVFFIKNKKENNKIFIEDSSVDFSFKKYSGSELIKPIINEDYNDIMYEKMLIMLGR